MKRPIAKSALDAAWKRGDYLAIADLALSACDRADISAVNPSAIFQALRSYCAKRQEYFLCVTLNGAHNVLDIHEITKGLVNRAMVHPREVFRPAILDNAVAIIVAHNHPSGMTTPSPEDIAITKRLGAAGELIGITLLDHVIIGRRDYVSLVERGIYSAPSSD